jgi:hypothetical protein
MIPIKKRLSTYANLITMVLGAAMIYIPDMQLEQGLTGKIMCACAVLVAGAQWYKQGAKDAKHD